MCWRVKGGEESEKGEEGRCKGRGREEKRVNEKEQNEDRRRKCQK